MLFFLLSLLIHARSRTRMLITGGTFVLLSGVIYFLFMAAWLNLFILIGGLSIITITAGAIALAVAAINIKDFFFFRKGVSLLIPESAKPRLFEQMRNLWVPHGLYEDTHPSQSLFHDILSLSRAL